MHLASLRTVFYSGRCFNVAVAINRNFFISSNNYAADNFDGPPTSSDSSPEALAKSGTHHAAQKIKKISKAMESYIKMNAEKKKIHKLATAEFQLGKRHLANIMNIDPDLMTSRDVEKAIEYLLPSGLFSDRSRPRLDHPNRFLEKIIPPQISVSGRPFDTFFYTLRPGYHQLLYDIYEKIDQVISYESYQVSRGITTIPEPLKLPLGGWKLSLKTNTAESLDRVDRVRLKSALEHLLSLPYSFIVKDYLMQMWRSHDGDQGLERKNWGRLMTTDDGRQYFRTNGYRKTCLATVKLFPGGSGKVTVNGRDLYHLDMAQSREIILSPFLILDRLREFDVEATTVGGGESGKAGAIRLAIARGLRMFTTLAEREKLRLAGYLTRDPRRKERSKPGIFYGARAKRIWKKR